MKLVEILAREWFEWPINHDVPLAQNADGGVFIPGSFRADGFNTGICMRVKQADDWRIGLVTRAQWEAERARIAAEDAPTWHIGTETEDWRNECQKQYEQELWDKVASEIFIRACDESIATYRQEEVDYVAVRASSYADAFMAERAKRLKK